MLRFKRLGVRESPLLPFHTGSRLPSKRLGRDKTFIQRLTPFAVVVLICVGGVYTLTHSGGVTARSFERSGRNLAEQRGHLEKSEGAEEDPSSRDAIIEHVQNQALHGMRSYAGREDTIQAKQQDTEYQIKPDSGGNASDGTLGAQAVDTVNATVVQPILETSAIAVDAIAKAADSVQQSAGQIDPAAYLVAKEIQPSSTALNTQPLPATQAEPQIQANALSSPDLPPATGLYTVKVKGIDGQEVDLTQFRGKVSLVVNVASECGFTDSNYNGLNQLYEKYRNRGFEILAFPCNNWNQETGSNSDIYSFARNKYGVKFPLFAKVEAIGPNIHPIFKWLTETLPEYRLTKWQPTWNFSKWLVNKKGFPVKSYQSAFNMDVLSADIESLLQEA